MSDNRKLRAYRITLDLYETSGSGEEECHHEALQVITLSKTLEEACRFCELAVKEADKPEPEFEWRAIHGEKIDGHVAIPNLQKELPKHE
jgi:hypothetical protein